MSPNGHPLAATPCSVGSCLALASSLPRLVFTPAQPAPGVARRSAVLLRLPLCAEHARELQEHPARLLTDARWRGLADAHRATGRALPDRDEVSVELVPLSAWRAGRRPAMQHPASRDPC